MLGHLGEAIPFLLDRIENRLMAVKSPTMKAQKPVSHYFKNNIYVTTSGNMSKEAFQCTKDVLEMDRILIGTDYPLENLGDMMNFIQNLDITDKEREQLYYSNAANLGINI